MLASVWLGTASLGAGCDLPPATAVAVLVKTELDLTQVAYVEYKVFRTRADPDNNWPVSKFMSPSAPTMQPFIVTRGHEDEFLLSVEGLAADKQTRLVVYREQVTFKEGKTLALPVFLANACYQRRCLIDDLTCYGMPIDGISAGECAAYPVRELEPIERPGQESAWEPVPTLLDAGFRPANPFPDDYDEYYDEDDDVRPQPRFDGGLTSASCSTPLASRSCLPSTFALDASVPLLDRQ